MQQFNHPCCTSFGHLGGGSYIRLFLPETKHARVGGIFAYYLSYFRVVDISFKEDPSPGTSEELRTLLCICFPLILGQYPC